MLVTPDDFTSLRDRIVDDVNRLDGQYGVRVLDKLVTAIEPRLVITEAGGAAAWLEAVLKARDSVARSELGIAPAFLDRLSRLAEKYLKVPSTEPQRRLTFMRDAGLRRVAEDDWTRLIAAAQHEDAKTTAIAAGSVVEAVALDVVEQLSVADVGHLRDHVNGLPDGERRGQRPARGSPKKWTFAFLLLSVGPHGLQILSARTHDVGHTLRDWRNLVHPNESRSEPPMSAADGRMAAGFAEKVIEDVECWVAAGASFAVPP